MAFGVVEGAVMWLICDVSWSCPSFLVVRQFTHACHECIENVQTVGTFCERQTSAQRPEIRDQRPEKYHRSDRAKPELG